MATTKRTPREAWEALEKQAREDEISRFLAKPASEVDDSLRAAGHDPAAVRAEGAALGKQLLADRDRLAWQGKAAEGLAREQARFERRVPKRADLSRDDLLAQIALASRDPRLARPAAVMFRNRKPEEASVEELRAMLEEIEALAEGDDSDK